MGLYEKYEDIGDERLNLCMFFWSGVPRQNAEIKPVSMASNKFNREG